jgi:glycosyltransferase involved in cell wall biosynthesis
MSQGLKIPGSFAAMRTEGGISVRNKKRAVAEEDKRRRKMAELTVTRDGRLDTGVSPPPVLNVAPFPPYPAFTGSQVAMADRLEVEKDKRTVALVYPRDGAWWLEVWSPASTGYFYLGTKSNLVEIVANASRLLRTKVVHVEDNNGLPLNLVYGLENCGLRTILSIHDFVFFCRRPHLVERPFEPDAEFCNYSTELLRCKVCLRDIDPGGRTTQADYRRQAGPSLHDASLLIFPSVFMQRQYEILFPDRRPGQREAVVAPATARGGAVAGGGGRPNIAFVGGVYAHRGAALVQPVMDRVGASEPRAAGFVYGDGDDELFRLLRKAKKLKIQGYYQRGSLPELLARDRIAVAVLPSIAPEAYSLAVDECLSAGVPVVAFEHGAVGERLSFWEVGELVPLDRGANGLADAVVHLLARRTHVPDSIIRTLPQLDRVARKYLELCKGQRARAQ